ncbi:carboxypeptidase regulatory-like domain-containing protein [Calycomorphotria hydatis]|nr:carboxypeptidase regulatory-like domain-containing protein [Calycomorphotria hydatis]
MLLSMGCGGSMDGLEYASVHGTVTQNGAPVKGVVVAFLPSASEGSLNTGSRSQGVTNRDGNYTLRVVTGDRRDGAVIGPHTVWVRNPEPIVTTDENGAEVIKKRGPLKDAYSFEFEVVAGANNVADFDLKK